MVLLSGDSQMGISSGIKSMNPHEVPVLRVRSGEADADGADPKRS
jgi:hypothetical protein